MDEPKNCCIFHWLREFVSMIFDNTCGADVFQRNCFFCSTTSYYVKPKNTYLETQVSSFPSWQYLANCFCFWFLTYIDLSAFVCSHGEQVCAKAAGLSTRCEHGHDFNANCVTECIDGYDQFWGMTNLKCKVYSVLFHCPVQLCGVGTLWCALVGISSCLKKNTSWAKLETLEHDRRQICDMHGLYVFGFVVTKI